MMRKSDSPGRRKKGTTAAKLRSVVVTVADEDLSEIHAIAEMLRSRGMRVESILAATGQITGAYAKPVSQLKGVRGVVDVEEPPDIQLPPPDSTEQ